MNMKKLLSILSIACLTLFPSCNDWLDITPQGQVEAEELYETTQGCNSVVTGIYHTLSSSSLFGQNLSYGLIDIMAQYWDFSTNTSHIYYPATQFNYDDTNVDGQITTMWQQLYYAITQCNAFIYYSDPYKENIKHYDLLLGEVYGLRALAHMTLFELYGPVIHSTADLQKSAIAYRTEYNNVSKNFDTGEVVLQKAAEDLNRAIELFAEDPIRDPENSRRADLNTSVLDYEDVLNFRGARMNYFCALGLMARLEMLRKNPTAAYTYATRVIQESEGILSLIDTNNIANNTNMSDWNFSTEILGSFYTNNLYDLTDDFFQMGENAGNTNNVIFIDKNRVEALTNYVYGRTPDGSGQDIRLFWFQGNQETGRNDFMKLKESPVLTTIDPYAYYPEVPIMRLSEIYYIACEAQIGVNNTLALEYLNDLRSTRRLDALTGPYDDATLLEYLVREARKDFIGEGRMFFMYKRLFYDIYTVRGLTVPATDAIYVLPIPDEEYEYTGQQKPAN